MDIRSEPLLNGLDLTEPQARVYLAALELGQGSMQDLARKSGVNRTTIYHFIEELKNRQLIMETRRKKRNLYSATHPNRLVETAKDRVREMERVLPELLAVYNSKRTKPAVTFYEGIEGIKEVYADTLRTKQPMIGWSDYEQSRRRLGSYFDTYAEERARRSIPYRVIARDTPAARERAKRSVGHLREVRFTSSSDMTTDIYIYGDKVAHLSFRSTPPFAVVLADPAVAASMRTIWEAAWQHLPAGSV